MAALPAYNRGEALDLHGTMSPEMLNRQATALLHQPVVYSCWPANDGRLIRFYSGKLDGDGAGGYLIQHLPGYQTMGTEPNSGGSNPIPAQGYHYGFLCAARAFVTAQANEVIAGLQRQLSQTEPATKPGSGVVPQQFGVPTTRSEFVIGMPETWHLIPDVYVLRALLKTHLQADSYSRRTFWQNCA